MTKHTSKPDLQQDLWDAHEECRAEDSRRRHANRLAREEWEAKGGPDAEDRHFDWLRIQPLGRVV
jgi:hypothetical protein